MKKTLVSLALPAALVAGALAVQFERAEAQLSVGVNLSWQWSDGGWSSGYAQPRGGAYYAPAPTRRTHYRAPARGVRIPPGHLPPPGACRLWYVGRPPGHQPPPTSCARLFRSYRQPGVIILQGAPVRRGDAGWYRYDPRWDREFRYGRDGRDGAYYRHDDDRWDRDRGDRVRSGPPGKQKRGKPGRGRGGG